MNNVYKNVCIADYKFADFIKKMEELAVQLCAHMSYKIECEGNSSHSIIVKIDGKSFYTEWYKNLCDKMGIDIEDLADKFNFPDTAYIDIPNINATYTLTAYRNSDPIEEPYNYYIGLSDTLDELIEDVKDFWRI